MSLIKKLKSGLVKIVLLTMLTGAAVGCSSCDKGDDKSPINPTDPTPTNHAPTIEFKRIDLNFKGSPLLIDFICKDQDGDNLTFTVEYKDGSLSSQTLDAYNIMGNDYQITSTGNLSNTGPFTLVARISDGDKYADYTVNSLVEQYKTKCQVVDGDTNPEIRISNADYDEWAKDIFETHPSANKWERNTTSDTEMAAIRAYFNGDSDKTDTQSYNKTSNYEIFEDAMNDTSASSISFQKFQH